MICKQLHFLHIYLPPYYHDYINRDNENPKSSNRSINNAIKKQSQQQALQTTASPTMLTYSSASRDAQSSTSRSPRTGGGRNNVTSRRDDVEYYMGSQSANMLWLVSLHLSIFRKICQKIQFILMLYSNIFLIQKYDDTKVEV